MNKYGFRSDSASGHRRLNQSVAEKVALRDRAGVTRLFAGLELVEPVLWGGVAGKPPAG